MRRSDPNKGRTRQKSKTVKPALNDPRSAYGKNIPRPGSPKTQRSSSPERKVRSPKNSPRGSPRSVKPDFYRPFHRDIAGIIAGYHIPHYKLLDWIPHEKIIPGEINLANPKAITYIEDILERYYSDPYTGKITYLIQPNVRNTERPEIEPFNIQYLSTNPNLWILFEDHPELFSRFHKHNLAQNQSPEIVKLMIDYYMEHPEDKSYIFLSRNPTAYEWVLEHKEFLEKQTLLFNPKAVALRKRLYKEDRNISPVVYVDLWKRLCSDEDWKDDIVQQEYKSNRKSKRLHWNFLSANPKYIKIIEEELKYPDSRVLWTELSKNPKAVHILERNQENIFWPNLALNPNPKAVDMAIEEYQKNKNSDILVNLCTNPTAIPFFEKNQNLIRWRYFSRNPDIFVLDRPKKKYVDALENLEL